MKLTLTKAIQDALNEALAHQPELSPALHHEASSAVKLSLGERDHGVSLALLRELASLLKKKEPGRVWFHELVRGSGVYIEPKPEEDPEVKEARDSLMQRIRDEQQNREYAAMVSSVITAENERFSLGIKPDEIKEVKSHIATIFNIGFSAAAVFTAVYVASRTMTDDLGIRMLLSLAGAILIIAVEATLYISYAQRATAPLSKKKSLKSKKLC